MAIDKRKAQAAFTQALQQISAEVYGKPLPSAEPEAQPTGSPWIVGWLNPGDQFGPDTLTATQHGVELADGHRMVDNAAGLAGLGHALVARFDGPDRETVQAAGLDPDRTWTWKDVAQAAVRMPVTVHIAEAETPRYTFVGTGHTEAEARTNLLTVWHRHAEHVGADPDYLTDDAVNVRTGLIGTAWQDHQAFPPPPHQ